MWEDDSSEGKQSILSLGTNINHETNDAANEDSDMKEDFPENSVASFPDETNGLTQIQSISGLGVMRLIDPSEFSPLVGDPEPSGNLI